MSQLDRLVSHRRVARGLPDDASNKWGLALSGGGIRSATFSLGFIQALARKKLLLEFDLVSTVSGGGYAGATIGRLFGRAQSLEEVQGVADAIEDSSPRWFLWWLRANGRYLIPTGAKDRAFAGALYLRNLIGVHLELGLVALLLGVLLTGVDLSAWWSVSALAFEYPDAVFGAARHLPSWFSTTWLLLVPPLVIGAILATAYWCIPWLSKWKSVIFFWVASAIALTGLMGKLLPQPSGRLAAIGAPFRSLNGWLNAGLTKLGVLSETSDWVSAAIAGSAGASDFGTRDAFLWLATALLAVGVIAVPVASVVAGPKAFAKAPPVFAMDEVRTRLTKWLAAWFRAGFWIAIAGAIDRFAWFLAFEFHGIAGAGLTLAIAAALLRGLLPIGSNLRPGGTGTGVVLSLGRVAGYLLVFLLCAWWVSLVERAALGAAFSIKGLEFANALAVLLAIAIPVVGYILLSGRNFAFLNLSSLHAFYRARLIRSYLGAANARRFAIREPKENAPPSPTCLVGEIPLPSILGAAGRLPEVMPQEPARVAVDDTDPGDDIALRGYLPHAHGGPVHLISVCVNQTRDPRGGLFNRDRRGLPLTVASGGLMKVDDQDWKLLDEDGGLTVGTWVAISGAAVSPGLGNLTRGGISALATFAGLRLGYWWPTPNPTGKWADRVPLTAKSDGLMSETFGVFEGTAGPNWFLSDGGHFENTGAYALLAERSEVVVLVDCGADPKYAFGDLENLTRKARIDLQASIEFKKVKKIVEPTPEPLLSKLLGRLLGVSKGAKEAQPWKKELAVFGSLNDLASSTSQACLALATITYGGVNPGKGILVLVKPNICAGLPVDLVNFKAQNPEFPQQSTADQFFSEAQWESYFRLGCFLGGHLDLEFLRELAAHCDVHFEADESAADATAKAKDEKAAAGSVFSRLPARIAATAATATLGFGAVATTVGVSAWQAIDSVRTAFDKKTSDERSALKELTDLWAKIPPASSSASAPAAYGALASTLARTADTLCPTKEEGWFQESPLALKIYNDTLGGCRALKTEAPSSCVVLINAADPALAHKPPNCLGRKDGPDYRPRPQYWAYDYSDQAPSHDGHPCDPLVIERLAYETKLALSGNPAFKDSIAAPDKSSGCQPSDRLFAGARSGTGSQVSPAGIKIASASSVSASAGGLPAAPLPVPTSDSALSTAPVDVAGVDSKAEYAQAAAVHRDRDYAQLRSQSTAAYAAMRAASVTAQSPPSLVPAVRVRDSDAQSNVCAGKTVLIRIYGPAQRDAVRAYREPWRKLGASVPPIDDVLSSARNAGRPSPDVVTEPVIRIADERSRQCADALARSIEGFNAAAIDRLPLRVNATPGTMEVWIPPLR